MDDSDELTTAFRGISRKKLPMTIEFTNRRGKVGVKESDLLAYLDRKTAPAEDEVLPGATEVVEGSSGTGTPTPVASPLDDGGPRRPAQPARQPAPKRPPGEPTNLREFGIAVYEYRQKHDLTQVRLGELIGVSGQTIANIEMGRKTGESRLISLANKLKLSSRTVNHLLNQKGRVQYPSRPARSVEKPLEQPSAEEPTPPAQESPVKTYHLSPKTQKALEMVCSLTGQQPFEVVDAVLKEHLKEHLMKAIEEL